MLALAHILEKIDFIFLKLKINYYFFGLTSTELTFYISGQRLRRDFYLSIDVEPFFMSIMTRANIYANIHICHFISKAPYSPNVTTPLLTMCRGKLGLFGKIELLIDNFSN